MQGGSATAVGEEEVSVEVRGESPFAIRGFSLAAGHDSTRLEILRVEPGPLFAGAELISTSVQDEAVGDDPPHGAIFVVLDFNPPLDQLPIEMDGGAVLARFVYRVRPSAEEGAAPIHLGQRQYGHPRVSIVYVDESNFEVSPALTDGEVNVTRSPVAIDTLEPNHGAIVGGTSVVIQGRGFALSGSVPQVSFGDLQAELVEVSSDGQLIVRSPPAAGPGLVAVRVETRAGTALRPDAFEYRSPPEVLAVEPRGGTDGGRLTIRGQGFTEDIRAFVGSLELTSVSVLSPESLEGDLASCQLQEKRGLVDVRVEEIDGSSTLVAGFDCSMRFLRGEANGDGRIDLSDALFALFFLFAGGPPPPCADAMDANDDGVLDLADPIAVLDFLFLDGAQPPMPNGSPGSDPTPDLLDCEEGV
jgi:hypothetical protein